MTNEQCSLTTKAQIPLQQLHGSNCPRLAVHIKSCRHEVEATECGLQNFCNKHTVKWHLAWKRVLGKKSALKATTENTTHVRK